MYFSQYRSNKKSYRKKNGLKDDKGLYGGIIRFTRLGIIIISIVPVVYLIDIGYKTLVGANRRFAPTTYLDHYLKVRDIKITGNNFIGEDELSTYLKGIKGHNILKVNIKDIASEVKRHPWIKDVSVRRELPATIFVDILERTPAVYIDNEGKLYLADEEGVILEDKTENILSLPVVYGVTLKGVRSGEKSSVEGLLSAIEAKRELSTIPWIDLSAAGIEVGERSQIVLHLKGYKIKLGRGRYKEKLKRFSDIVKNLQDKGVTYKEVDLRFDNQVIVKTVGI